MSLPPHSDLLQYLYRADVGTYSDADRTTPQTADGGTVLGWADQGDNLTHIGAAGAGPTLRTNQINTTMPCLRFVGGGAEAMYLRAAFQPVAWTLFAVVKISGSGVYTISAGNTASLQWRLDGFQQRLVSASTADIGFGTNSISSGVWTQINASWDGSAGVLRMASAADGTVSGSGGNYATRCVGMKSDVAEVFVGDMAMYAAFDGVLTTGQRQDVEAWISSEWGVP